MKRKLPAKAEMSDEEAKKAALRAKYEKYRRGGDGFIQWCEENVRIPVYHVGETIPRWTPMGELPDTPDPDTGRSYQDFWNAQKVVVRNALAMGDDGQLKHRLIALCWPRGDGKSFLAVLIQLWKFFCFARQQIVFGANSKEQTKFVHYDIAKELILNSPKLLSRIGLKNVQEKEIRIKNKDNNTVSVIRAISSFSGIVSNITGYTFSEMFDMKNPKFFVQLDGSTRNIPNALGVVDSTVSEKTHILFQLYESFTKKKDPSLYFSYRSAPNADQSEYWHPRMKREQIESYRTKFPEVEFNRYFKNVWGASSGVFFSKADIMVIQYMGIDGLPGIGAELKDICGKIVQSEEMIEKLDVDHALYAHTRDVHLARIHEEKRRLLPVANTYKLRDSLGAPMQAIAAQLEDLSRIWQTNWSILAGVDRADPDKNEFNSNARTIVTIIAKGLPNSINNREMLMRTDVVPSYIYFLLNLVHVSTSALEDIKAVLMEAHNEYNGLDTLCSEKWGMWDLKDFCEMNGIQLELVTHTYPTQKAIFSELFTITTTGRFKSPAVGVMGSKEPDILREEMGLFESNPSKKWYGSPEKDMRHGVQDDSMFALAHGIYGGRNLGIEHFRARRVNLGFGQLVIERNVVGHY